MSWKRDLVIFFLIFLAVLIIYNYWIADQPFRVKQFIENAVSNTEKSEYVWNEDEGKEADQFATSQVLHYKHMPIKVGFEEDCIGKVKDRVHFALGVISNETESIVYFEDGDIEEADLRIVCIPKQKEKNVDKTMAEGGPDYTEGKAITQGSVTFYGITNTSYTQSCFNFPLVEIHEIFHTFGFGHYKGHNLGYDVMQPQYDQFSCKYVTKINERYISCLKTIYTNAELDCPEVEFLE